MTRSIPSHHADMPKTTLVPMDGALSMSSGLLSLPHPEEDPDQGSSGVATPNSKSVRGMRSRRIVITFCGRRRNE